MSCYIVTDNHLSAIIDYARRSQLQIYGGAGSGQLYQPGMEQEAVNTLYAANVKSVNYRYKESTPEVGAKYITNAPALDAIGVIKAIDGLAYQCDAWEGYEDSNAQKLLQTIQRYAVTQLSGYDKSSWSIE